jgi:hypothetical protein
LSEAANVALWALFGHAKTARRSPFSKVERTSPFYRSKSESDLIETRPGFAALLDRIEGNGVRTVIVEDASRSARDLMTQELGILADQSRGAGAHGRRNVSPVRRSPY